MNDIIIPHEIVLIIVSFHKNKYLLRLNKCLEKDIQMKDCERTILRDKYEKYIRMAEKYCRNTYVIDYSQLVETLIKKYDKNTSRKMHCIIFDKIINKNIHVLFREVIKSKKLFNEQNDNLDTDNFYLCEEQVDMLLKNFPVVFLEYVLNTLDKSNIVFNYLYEYLTNLAWDKILINFRIISPQETKISNNIIDNNQYILDFTSLYPSIYNNIMKEKYDKIKYQ